MQQWRTDYSSGSWIHKRVSSLYSYFDRASSLISVSLQRLIQHWNFILQILQGDRQFLQDQTLQDIPLALKPLETNAAQYAERPEPLAPQVSIYNRVGQKLEYFHGNILVLAKLQLLTANWSIFFSSSNVYVQLPSRNSIIILFRKNVHLTGMSVKGLVFLFSKKCSHCYACNYSYLLIVVMLIILITRMFSDSFSLHKFCFMTGCCQQWGEKRSVFCFIYSFNILFLEKYILPGHFLLLQTCPNRHWKTKIINAIWVF